MPSSVSFSPVDVTPGQPDASQSVTVHNPNARPLRITGARIAKPFVITTDPCLTQPIPANSSCTITVQFAPQTPGAITQILVVDSRAGEATARLSGTGDAVLNVTISGDEPGSVAGGAIHCSYDPRLGSSGPCSLQITSQLNLTLTAQFGEGIFFEWGGGCLGSGQSSTCPLAITADTNVSAQFNAN
jgi:hypothetical protein